MTGFVLMPVIPTPEMLLAYRRALRNHIISIPFEQRTSRKRKDGGSKIPDREKAMIRYQAMITARPMKSINYEQ